MAAALRSITTPVMMGVQRLFFHRDSWRPWQYAAVATALLAEEHHALPVSKAKEVLGYEGGEVLEAMLMAGVLAYRPVSGMHHLVCLVCLE